MQTMRGGASLFLLHLTVVESRFGVQSTVPPAFTQLAKDASLTTVPEALASVDRALPIDTATENHLREKLGMPVKPGPSSELQRDGDSKAGVPKMAASPKNGPSPKSSPKTAATAAAMDAQKLPGVANPWMMTAPGRASGVNTLMSSPWAVGGMPVAPNAPMMAGAGYSYPPLGGIPSVDPSSQLQTPVKKHQKLPGSTGLMSGMLSNAGMGQMMQQPSMNPVVQQMLAAQAWRNQMLYRSQMMALAQQTALAQQQAAAAAASMQQHAFAAGQTNTQQQAKQSTGGSRTP
eukprot:TRINITY_DN77413_c0_g1_i1.p1 TRINITY_DN77413_c0_g1~~TRINITY_DN77413_c0_g1_i1.p1  ORF type:complete len:290 (-),score=55.75 TRINITY_DN77413_c0_g1_i1:61-930(-)